MITITERNLTVKFQGHLTKFLSFDFYIVFKIKIILSLFILFNELEKLNWYPDL